MKFKWELSDVMAEYANEHLNIFIQEKDLKESVLKTIKFKRPVINLKNLNPYIPYHHLKMESLQSLRDILKKGDFMCKLDLKDAYFCIPFAEELEKFMRFYRERDLYQFLCLCFGLASAHYIFKKLLKILIAFLRRIGT